MRKKLGHYQDCKNNYIFSLLINLAIASLINYVIVYKMSHRIKLTIIVLCFCFPQLPLCIWMQNAFIGSLQAYKIIINNTFMINETQLFHKEEVTVF